MTDEFTRTVLLSGSSLEPLRGYSRAVQIGNSIFVSGTTALTSRGEVTAPGDSYEQTKYALGVIRNLLVSRGFSLEDVTRTRLFVTNIGRWDDYAKAHREFFEKIRPASSMVQVVKLVDPRLTVEIEVEAVRGAGKIEVVKVDLEVV